MKFYTLEGRTPVACDILTWGAQLEDKSHVVAYDEVGDVAVSTVFLGLDHNFRFVGPEAERIPVLFETMVFGGPLDQCRERYQTWEEAEAGHRQWLRKVKDKSHATT